MKGRVWEEKKKDKAKVKHVVGETQAVQGS